jgi:hypothetical protein
MSGSTGQAMPTQFAQPGGDKGTGQPTQTAMGTPIIYGKSYLNNSNYSSNPVAAPLSVSNQPYSDNFYGGSSVSDGGPSVGVSSDGMGPGVGEGTGGASPGDSGDGGTGAASSATGDGGGGSGGK